VAVFYKLVNREINEIDEEQKREHRTHSS
jgi:hypothetical protein